MKKIGCILGLSLMVAVSLATIPLPTKVYESATVTKQATILMQSLLATAPSTNYIFLSWTYNYTNAQAIAADANSSNLIFQVFATTNLFSPFTFLAQVSGQTFGWTQAVILPQMFLKVRASNQVTHAISPWAS